MASSKKYHLFWVFNTDGTLLYPTKPNVFAHTAQPDPTAPPVKKILKKLFHKQGQTISLRQGQSHFKAALIFAGSPEGEANILLVWNPDPPDLRELAELLHSNKELEAIIESSHDGIVVADEKGTLIRLSNSYSRITGIPKEELLGKNVNDMVREGLVAPSGTELALREGKSGTVTQTYRSGRQSVVTSSLVRDNRGRIIRVVTNVRDMTEIQQLRDELNESRAAVARYSRIVETLTQQQAREDGLVFRSQRMEQLRERALRFAEVDAPLLITGESGVGKEVVANFVHKHGSRRDFPFLKINCGAIPEQLLESELFGYEGGAFTGARREGRLGLLEQAKGGSVLLDEIGEMPLSLQVKLLRFVQHKEFIRVGGNKTIFVDARLIAATNQDLSQMVHDKVFRIDLYYRLNVLSLHIPPLSARPEDIIPLAHYFLENFNKKYGTYKQMTPAACYALENYVWPGNIRELENIMERLVITATGDLIQSVHLPRNITFRPDRTQSPLPSNYREAVDAFEKNFWARAMERFPTCRAAAGALGVDHSTVVKKLARYGLSTLERRKKVKEQKKTNSA